MTWLTRIRSWFPLAAAARNRSEKPSNGSAGNFSRAIHPASAQRSNWRRALWNSPSVVSTLRGPFRRGGHQANQEIMGIRGENDCRGVVRAEFARDMLLGFGPDLLHHLVPLAVGKARGVVPGGDLASEA